MARAGDRSGACGFVVKETCSKRLLGRCIRKLENNIEMNSKLICEMK